jgi:hypothetical protein
VHTQGGANAGAEERCREGISQGMQPDGRASFVLPRSCGATVPIVNSSFASLD